MDRPGDCRIIDKIRPAVMEQFITLRRSETCAVIGGGTNTTEGRVARMLGRLVGAALRALYDLLRNGQKPQAAHAL